MNYNAPRAIPGNPAGECEDTRDARIVERNIERKPEIAIHIDEQTKLIEELSINLSELEERLSPIMGPVPPTEGAEGKQPLTTRTRLGNVLEEDNRRIGHLINRLVAIKKRLEI